MCLQLSSLRSPLFVFVCLFGICVATCCAAFVSELISLKIVGSQFDNTIKRFRWTMNIDWSDSVVICSNRNHFYHYLLMFDGFATFVAHTKREEKGTSSIFIKRFISKVFHEGHASEKWFIVQMNKQKLITRMRLYWFIVALSWVMFSFRRNHRFWWSSVFMVQQKKKKFSHNINHLQSNKNVSIEWVVQNELFALLLDFMILGRDTLEPHHQLMTTIFQS